MNINKFSIGILIVISGLISLVFANQTVINRDEIIEKILLNSPDIYIQANGVKKAQEEYNNAFVRKMNIDDFLKIDDRLDELQYKENPTIEEELELQYLRMILATNLSNEEVYDLTISRETGIDIAAYNLELNKAKLQSLKNKSVLNINSLLSNLSKIDKSINLKKHMVQNLELNYNKATKKYNLGLIPQLDLKQQYLKLQKEKIQVNNLNYQREMIINNIHVLMGEDPTKHYNEYKFDNEMDLSINSIETYINTALNQRVEISNANKLYEMYQRVYDITQRYYPLTSDKINIEAVINLRDAKNTVEQIILSVQNEVSNAYKDVQNKLNNMKSAEYKLEISGTKYKEIQAKYELGYFTELELGNSYLEYCNAQLDYLNAQYDVYQSKLVLLDACGYNLINI